jgi:hypothetical protein
MYWDIALHIDLGRDEGPLANPAHYLSSSASTASSPPARWPSRCRARRAPRPRRAEPEQRLVRAVGGVLMAACGGFALIGFPLDDMWHRLFGQDVTLWGPTHLMLIGGAGMTLVGQAVLLAEGMKQLAIDRGERVRRGSQRMPSAIVALRARASSAAS